LAFKCIYLFFKTYTMDTKKSKKTAVSVFKIDNGVLVGTDVSFVSQGVKLYFNAQHKLMHLDTLQRMYFDFMCEQMDHRNCILLKPEFRSAFLTFLESVGYSKKIPTVRTLGTYEKLMENLLLIFKKPKRTSIWIINPKHVFKGTETERTKLLKNMAKWAITDEKVRKAILNVPDSSLTAPAELLQLGWPNVTIEEDFTE
jgi:hypothetical protein